MAGLCYYKLTLEPATFVHVRTIGYYLYTKSFYASAHPISWKGRTEKESAILPWTSCVSREEAKIVPKANHLEVKFSRYRGNSDPRGNKTKLFDRSRTSAGRVQRSSFDAGSQLLNISMDACIL